MKTKIYFILAAMILSGTSCMKQEAETDNIPQAAASCDDGIMNQGETDIDCGGPALFVWATSQPRLMVLILMQLQERYRVFTIMVLFL